MKEAVASRQMCVSQLRLLHDDGRVVGVEGLATVDSCRSSGAARLGCSCRSCASARSSCPGLVGEAAAAIWLWTFVPRPRLRHGDACSGVVGRSLGSMYRSALVFWGALGLAFLVCTGLFSFEDSMLPLPFVVALLDLFVVGSSRRERPALVAWGDETPAKKVGEEQMRRWPRIHEGVYPTHRASSLGGGSILALAFVGVPAVFERGRWQLCPFWTWLYFFLSVGAFSLFLGQLYFPEIWCSSVKWHLPAKKI